MTYSLRESLEQLTLPRPGWVGSFATTQVLGAWRNGTRVIKVKGEPGDTTPLGTLGTVLGSVYQSEYGLGYFIEWDDKPKCAVLVIAYAKRCGVKAETMANLEKALFTAACEIMAHER